MKSERDTDEEVEPLGQEGRSKNMTCTKFLDLR